MVTENPHLEDVSGLQRIWFEIGARYQYYPLVYTSYWLEHKVWGLDPTGYHVVNLILHILNAFLVWRLIRGLGLPGGWFVAGLFALHPVQVTSVAWITERKNVLTGLFGLLSTIQFSKGYRLWETGHSPSEHRSGWHFCTGYIFFVLALLSKTSTCVLPAILLILLWWKKRLSVKSIGWLMGLFILSAGSAVLTIYMELHHIKAVGSAWDHTFLERIQIAARSLWGYVFNEAWPFHIQFFYPRWDVDAGRLVLYGPVIAWMGVLGAGVYYTWRTSKRGFLAGILMYGVVMSPVLGFINVYCMQYSFVMDHWQYLAAIIFFTWVTYGLAQGMTRLRFSPRLLSLGGVGVMLGLASLTYGWTGYFKNEHVLWERTLEQNPEAWLAHNNLGTWALQNGNRLKGKAHLEAALDIYPDNPLVLHNLGTVLFKEGKLKEARMLLDRAVQLDPYLLGGYEVLGFIALKEGDKSAAIRLMGSSISMGSENPDLLYHYVRLKRPENSLIFLTQAIEKKPMMEAARYLLAQEFHRTGNVLQAVKTLRGLVQDFPHVAQYYNDLAWFKTQSQAETFDIEEGLLLAHKACNLTGYTDANFLDTLALAYQAAGDEEKAKKYWLKAISLAESASDFVFSAKLRSKLATLTE